MKYLASIIFLCLSFTLFGQSKLSSISYDKLIPIEGSDYVVATVENTSKIGGIVEIYLLFINTSNGEATQADFRNDARLIKVEPIVIKEQGIAKLIVEARTVSLRKTNTISWNSPIQLIAFSVDGKEKVQLTDDRFFVRTWAVNTHNGSITVAGHYDSNGNGKYDKRDVNEIHIYSLKNLELITKL